MNYKKTKLLSFNRPRSKTLKVIKKMTERLKIRKQNNLKSTFKPKDDPLLFI